MWGCALKSMHIFKRGGCTFCQCMAAPLLGPGGGSLLAPGQLVGPVFRLFLSACVRSAACASPCGQRRVPTPTCHFRGVYPLSAPLAPRPSSPTVSCGTRHSCGIVQWLLASSTPSALTNLASRASKGSLVCMEQLSLAGASHFPAIPAPPPPALARFCRYAVFKCPYALAIPAGGAGRRRGATKRSRQFAQPRALVALCCRATTEQLAPAAPPARIGPP